jgi:hypothetical protein
MLRSNIGGCPGIVETPGTLCDGGQHQGDRIAVGRDRQPREGYAGDDGLRRGGVRYPRRCRHIEVYDPRNKRHRLVLQLLNSKAAYFEKTGERGRGPCYKAILNGFDMNTVVSDQTRKDEPPAFRGLNEVKDQPRFPRPGRAANENRPRADQDG